MSDRNDSSSRASSGSPGSKSLVKQKQWQCGKCKIQTDFIPVIPLCPSCGEQWRFEDVQGPPPWTQYWPPGPRYDSGLQTGQQSFQAATFSQVPQGTQLGPAHQNLASQYPPYRLQSPPYQQWGYYPQQIQPPTQDQLPAAPNFQDSSQNAFASKSSERILHQQGPSQQALNIPQAPGSSAGAQFQHQLPPHFHQTAQVMTQQQTAGLHMQFQSPQQLPEHLPARSVQSAQAHFGTPEQLVSLPQQTQNIQSDQRSIITPQSAVKSTERLDYQLPPSTVQPQQLQQPPEPRDAMQVQKFGQNVINQTDSQHLPEHQLNQPAAVEEPSQTSPFSQQIFPQTFSQQLATQASQSRMQQQNELPLQSSPNVSSEQQEEQPKGQPPTTSASQTFPGTYFQEPTTKPFTDLKNGGAVPHVPSDKQQDVQQTSVTHNLVKGTTQTDKTLPTSQKQGAQLSPQLPLLAVESSGNPPISPQNPKLLMSGESFHNNDLPIVQTLKHKEGTLKSKQKPVDKDEPKGAHGSSSANPPQTHQTINTLCNFCGKQLLQSDAKICNSCGRQQRKQMSVANASSYQQMSSQNHPLSDSSQSQGKKHEEKSESDNRPKLGTSQHNGAQVYQRPPEAPVLHVSSIATRNQNARRDVSFDGLKASQKSVCITFHCLVQKALWEWEQNSFLSIRFGHKSLGQWTDCGHFQEVREFDDGYVEMSITFNKFDVDILKHPLPYKYVVSTPKAKKDEERYEYLHKHNATYWTRTDLNRCLSFSSDQHHKLKGGKWHQYDTIVYPKNTHFSQSFKKSWSDLAKGWSDRAKGFLSGLVGSNKGKDGDLPDSFTPKDHQEANVTCLYKYLHPYQEMLNSGKFEQGVNIHSAAMEIAHICQSLSVDYVSPSSSHYPSAPEAKRLQKKDYDTEILIWFQSIVSYIMDNSDMGDCNKVLSSLCVLHCLNMLKLNLHDATHQRFLLDLANMISLLLTTDGVKLPGVKLSALAEDVSKLCIQLSQVTPFAVEWFFLVPVYHYLEGREVQPDVNHDFNYGFYNSRFGLQAISAKAQRVPNFVEIYYDKVEEYFNFEPSLQTLFVYVAPKSEFSALCKRVPPHLVTELLVKYSLRPIEQKDIAWYKASIEQIKNAVLHLQEHHHLYAMVNSSVRLCEKVLPKMKSRDIELVKTALSCALFAIQQIYKQTLSETEVGKKEKKKAVDALSKVINEWISKPDVIGGSVFGYHTPTSNKKGKSSTNWKGKQELEVWNSLLSIELTSAWQVLHDWQHIIMNRIRDRVYAITNENLKVDLVIEMESITCNIHPILSEVVMEAALTAIDVLLNKPERYRTVNIERLAARESGRVGQLLGRIIKKRYPQPVKDITIEDLFSWNLWPKFITVHDCRPKLKEGLPEYCQTACSLAKETVISLCDRFKSGDVKLKEVKIVKRGRELMIKLYEAAYGLESEKRDAVFFSDLADAVSKRINEHDMFCECHSRLLYLCRQISIEIEGLFALIQELGGNYDSKRINELCVTDQETSEVQFVCFKSAESLCKFSKNFYIMSHEHGCDLFAWTWKSALKNATKDNDKLILENVHPLVWEPCINSCKELLLSLSSLSTKLIIVDKKLKPHQNKLDTQLFTLLRGVKLCTGLNIEDDKINAAIAQVKQYWNLCRFQDGANIFLSIRTSLGLTKGDFTLVEKLSKELTSTSSQTLSDVNDSLVQAGEFLEDIAKDQVKVDCLYRFSRCQEIVHWLKEVTNDVNEIQNFVNVALATAAGGEGDLSHDKLSHLRTVGSGYGSLIYGLSETTGFIELKRACTHLWEALANNPSLPKLLEDCNKDIGWYKSVKDTQGSVEVTSFGQMRNILKYGHFIVGTTLQSKQVHDIYHLISLKVIPRDKPLTKTSYNLDELRDLESKLVLITGSKAENRTEVDHYLNVLQHVSRIAEALLALQQAGNVKYSGWMMNFNCATYLPGQSPKQEPQLEVESAKQRVVELKNVAKNMEAELDAWVNELAVSRSNYYKLNYYTTLQVLRLRKELGQCRGPISREVLALLQSISFDVTSQNVQVILNDVIQERSTKEISANVQESETVVVEITPKPTTTDNQATPSSESQESQVNQSDDTPPSEIVQSKEEMKEAETKATQASLISESQGSTSLEPSEDSLNEKQKEIFYNLTGYSGYHKLLVLKALKECPDADKYDIEDWCDQNEGEIMVETGHSDEDTVSQSDSEDASTSDENMSSSETEVTVAETTASISSGVTLSVVSKQAIVSAVKTIHKRIIDDTHSVVQELVNDYDYEVEDAIEAVQLCGSLNKAIDFLTKKENEGSEGHWLQATWEPDTEESESIVVYDDTEVEKKYLSLEELGTILEKLSLQLSAVVKVKRAFMNGLKTGTPNLIVTAPDEVLRTVLALYMEDETLPLPTLEEVLICNSSTTTEEVCLLWRRAIGDPEFKRIFCLVHAEKLSYQVCDKALESLKELSQGKQGYHLVIICSKEGEDKSHMVSKLMLHKKSLFLKHSDEECRDYLKRHFSSTATEDQLHASVIDIERSNVRVISSNRGGMGKTLYVKRMADKLTKHCTSQESVYAVIPIHGPVVTSDVVLKLLRCHYDDRECMIYHLDIAPSVITKVDTILFSLLVLHGLSDSQGHIWRCHSTHMYAVEVTTLENIRKSRSFEETTILRLLRFFPRVDCLSPKQVFQSSSLDTFQIGMDEIEFQTTAQRVYQYLRRHVSKEDLDKFTYVKAVEGDIHDCLQLFLQFCGVEDPSWSEIHHFYKFLDLQLDMCENSTFCNKEIVGDALSGLKGFVVKFMIRMSRDFATPSLQGEVIRDNQPEEEEEVLEKYQIESRRRWEQSSHPCIFFNKDGFTFTFVGFIINSNYDLLDNNQETLERNIMSKALYEGLKRNGVNLADDHKLWKKTAMIDKIATVMGLNGVNDPDDTYVLTVDNVIKILAIQTRFRCGIPVIIMGETGCGKTRLIRYMCDIAKPADDGRNMLILKVHGGTREEDVVKFVMTAEEEAKNNKSDTVVFFDEANTTDAIGLIKEILCDQRLHGRPLSTNLKFIAACNPYRKHSKEMIEKLENAGLGFYVRDTDTHQRLGKIPLRQLVYRVLDLPPSLRPLVYDFGQLNQDTEDNYIAHIVGDHVRKHDGLSKESPDIVPVITGVLATSQAYMRDRKDECSFVSLRDVERTMLVFEYFYGQIDDFRNAATRQQHADDEPEESENEVSLSKVTTALILSVSVCYQARLQDRLEYEKKVSAKFLPPLDLPNGDEQFRCTIKWYQNVLLDNMMLGPNIAKNAALRENVFMMAICVELRIPLFLVGKPGSSKSLAKSIIQDSMNGSTSVSELLKKFKQVNIFSYQCSQLSTSESVIEVFKSAKRFQSKQDTSKFVSVVVLDEVGLAEDSPNLPLKALHPLLEDGSEGAGAEGRDEVIEREERVSFIGISNWALDPAKMNRGVMVTRGAPDIKELEFSAQGICGKGANNSVKANLEPFFKPLAEAYEAICEKQEREFFGLRDFYSLIKMLFWMCKKSEGRPLTWPQMKHAILRNFGGLESDKLDPFEEFRMRLNMPEMEPRREDYDDSEVWSVVNPDCSRLGLIKTSLDTRETSFHGENRYLLFLTENYAALDILEHYIRGKKVERTETADSQQEIVVEGEGVEQKPFTLFGSSFPKDKEYTQVCRNINQIKICMETGRTVILLNLENLYESLYDVLNQYYMHYGDSRYVDLGLQTHRVKCRVHNDFKLILIAERATVYEKFPTPLINRLEKHFVLTSSVLKEWQMQVLVEFEDWIKAFSRVKDGDFKEQHSFIGYQRDTAAAVVFQACRQLKQLLKEPTRCTALRESGILDDIPLDELYETDENPSNSASESEVQLLDTHETKKRRKNINLWKYAVLKLSQYFILLTASDDALIRLKKTALADKQNELVQLYFSKQHHNSIVDFMQHQIDCDDGSQNGLLVQVTTHSHLLVREELKYIEKTLELKVECFLLQEFDTELDFSNKIGPIFQREVTEDDSGSQLIVIQCDSGHNNGDLIACARYRIYDERVKSLDLRKDAITHVLLIINLPHELLDSSFVGFQGDPWISAHIDDLKPSSEATIQPQEAISETISKIFIGRYLDNKNSTSSESQSPPTETSIPQEEPKTKVKPVNAQCRRLHSCIQAAVSKLEDVAKNRSTQRVSILAKLIPKEPPFTLDQNSFYGALVMRIYQLLCEREADRPDLSDWVLREALNTSKLEVGGTFRNVLARKIDEVVIPIFSKIIGCIDCNCNIDLISGSEESLMTIRCEFWIAVFSDPGVFHLKYSEMVQGNTVVGRIVNQQFKCQMPFFWLIKEAIDSVEDDARSRAGEGTQAQHEQLCAFIINSSVGGVLQTVSRDYEEFYNFYLHDFVRTVHMCKYKDKALEDMEYEVLTKALNSLVHAPGFCSANVDSPVISRIAALHLAFEMNKSPILWFSQLASHSPGILKSLCDQVYAQDIPEMVLHLYAAKKVMDTMEPPLKKDDPTLSLAQWLNYVRLSQTVIDSIMALDSQSRLVHEARLIWNRIRAMKLFVEHIMLKFPEEVDAIKSYARRLWGRWEKDSNFLKVDTIENVKLQLENLQKKIKKSKELKKSCSNFFLEIISNLCFGGEAAPESKLIKMLLDTVFAESTQELTPYKQVKPDKSPTIRSFLLQLLMEHSTAEVRGHMKDYFSRSCYVLSGKQADQDLYLLIIKCFEDSLNKALARQHMQARTRSATDILYEGLSALRSHKTMTPQLEYLEGVAKVRSALSVVAEMLALTPSDEMDLDLLKASKSVCTDELVNCIDTAELRNTVGPSIYLIKLLVRQYGIPQLKSASENHDWIIPPPLKPDEYQALDPFVIYGDQYKAVRKSIAELMYTNQADSFESEMESLPQKEPIQFHLSLYEKATISQSSTHADKRISDQIRDKLDDFIKSSTCLSEDLRRVARAILANQQGGVLAQMVISPNQPIQCRTLTGLVMHTAVVIFSRLDIELLLPFVSMLTNPAALNQSYLPTMPEDPFQEILETLRAQDKEDRYHSGRFYKCPNDHIYWIGDCGGATETGKCNVCQAPIGGTYHKLLGTNKEVNFQDTTKRGHDLGATQNRVNAQPERFLSARSVCILRALMHSTLIWACCNQQNAAVAFVPMVHPQQQSPDHLPELFWRHLEKDVELLGKEIGRGFDETVVLVHLVLKQILTATPLTEGSVQRVSSLKEKEHRRDWEKMFDQHYILPVVKKLDQEMEKAMDLIASDDQHGNDQLFYLVYEKLEPLKEALAPHLWTYRSRITLEHLRQTLQDKKLKEEHKILHEFLQNESELRATLYLPDIVKLQHCLYDRFNRQIDIVEAKKLSIKAFIKQLPNESIRNAYRQMIASLQSAWKLVGFRLSSHGRLPVKEEYCIPEISDDTPIEYIIPTTSDAGACTTALVDFLALTHNTFIESCRREVAKRDQSALSFWREHNIPITHLHRCHLLDYEHQLPSIIVSHCKYSLRVGKGQDVKYDHHALEKHLLNRFIYGKPLILLDFPQVVYRKDIYSTVTFTGVRDRVKPQVTLALRVKQDILSELRSLDRLRETLDVIEIVLGFLSSGGGKPEKKLGEYIDKTLRMKSKRVSQKAKKECQLKHILSLWETVAVELAKRLYLKKQEPFESMNPKYMRELSKNEDGEDQFAALDRCLGQFDPDNLLGVLYEFIETYIKHRSDNECDQPLSITLEIVLDPYGLELPQIEEFPMSIKLDQAVAAWKHITTYTTKKH